MVVASNTPACRMETTVTPATSSFVSSLDPIVFTYPYQFERGGNTRMPAKTVPISQTSASVAVELVNSLIQRVKNRANKPKTKCPPKNPAPAASTRHNGKSMIHSTSSLSERQPRNANPHTN